MASDEPNLTRQPQFQEPPPILYHYTSAAGLLGIVTQRCIWATDLHFLNDSRELIHALELASQIIQSIKPHHLSQHQVELGMKMLGDLRRFADVPIFVASFSENGDLLSQWRAYCPSAGGYSVGIRTSSLRANGEERFSLRPCIYDPERQRALVKVLILQVLQFLPDASKSGAYDVSDGAIQGLALGFLAGLAKLAPLLKDQAFSAEREWRLVSSDTSVEKFRATSRRVVPYVEIPLAAGDAPLEIGHLIVGPTEDPQLSRASAGRLFYVHGVAREWRIDVSPIPYRGTGV
ncbi:MAG: DUF2971 domain-containing protein [Candidatus Omnitrophota bacterium]|nr:DUF2971 domain-containing protein [Candidatus Omnitrophota bacterium]